MKKPNMRNPFFMFPAAIILINYALLYISYYIQNNTGWKGRENIFGITGLEAWNTAIKISEVSLLLIILLLIVRIVFIIIKKINLSEFLIGFSMNLVALFSCLTVIMNRI